MQFIGQHIHFMGVGGIGVSALAEMALAAGARVSGCDRSENELTRKLAGRGIRIDRGHDPAHVADADLVVHTSAIPPDHPERLAAGGRGEKRGAFLARFMEGRPSIGVSGTHGKTTTSWLLSHLLIQAGADPALFIGGIAPDLPDGNFRLGGGPFVAELDESDASFLLPRLSTAVVTNIESEHLSHYRDDARLIAAFEQFARGVGENGLLVAGVDNCAAAALYGAHRGRKLSFGFSPEAEARADGVEARDGASGFRLWFRGRDMGRFALPLPGRHNVQNALAALAVLLEDGMPAEVLRTALASVRGVGRRMELLGSVGGADLYSDYAHHPTEVAATVAALREKYRDGVLVVFQPHLFSRTRDYAKAFGRALADADAAVVTEIYPAREEPLPGVDAAMLVAEAGRARADADVTGPIDASRAGDVVRARAGKFRAVVMMGAGSIDAEARKLAAACSGESRRDEGVGAALRS